MKRALVLEHPTPGKHSCQLNCSVRTRSLIIHLLITESYQQYSIPCGQVTAIHFADYLTIIPQMDFSAIDQSMTNFMAAHVKKILQ